eukprot:gene1039-1318_t
MALIGKIREKTKLLISIVSIGLLVFIGRELLGGISSFSSHPPQAIGKVAGKTISVHAFQRHLEDLQRKFSMTYQQAPSDEINKLFQKQVWDQLTNELIYEQIFKKLAITVGPDELVDMVQGSHIHPDLQAAFTNPTTKEFSKKDLLTYLQNVAQLPAEQQKHWHELEQNLSFSRCQTKFDQLMRKSVFVNSLEAAQQFHLAQTTLDFQYIYVPYQSISKEGISVTDPMLQSYLDKHATDYMVEESKHIHYVTLPILASQQDQILFQNELQTLKSDFINAQDAAAFASIHTEASPLQVILKCQEQDLPAPLIAQKATLKKGNVMGPIAVGDTHKLYKVINVTTDKKYEFVVVEKRFTPSDETKEVVFREADDFIHQVKNTAQFKKQAAAHSWTIQKASIHKNGTSIGKLANARELIRWAYTIGKVGHVSPIFEIDNHYVMATITSHTPAGVAPLKKVKAAVTQQVVNEQKAKIILEKLTPLPNMPFEKLATHYGIGATVSKASKIKFQDNYLPGIGLAPCVIGQAFGLETKQSSNHITDATGVFMICIEHRDLKQMPKSWQKNQAEQIATEQYNLTWQLPKALSKITQLQDHRLPTAYCIPSIDDGVLKNLSTPCHPIDRSDSCHHSPCKSPAPMKVPLDTLNAQQQQAVLHTEGPYMIIAGAGSGKTKVLTTRIAYLIETTKATPSQILALTFTNKAAMEMKKRIEHLVALDTKHLWLGTFHSCFVRLLRTEAVHLGYPTNFSIYDTTDSKSLIKSIIKEMNLDDKVYTPTLVLSRLSAAKNRLITAHTYATDPSYQQDDESAMKPKMGEIFIQYAKRCFQAGAMDFDDILLNTYTLFQKHPDVLEKYQKRFQYILIDEFQDTNLVQYAIVKDLAKQHRNICVVGDDAQSIYAFRGANIRNILNFEKDYPDLNVTKLEQNYRSTQHIVAAANTIIKQNQMQLKKNVWTANPKGELLELIRSVTDAEEGRLVAASIFKIKMQKQRNNEDFAVLYRTNSQSRSIEEALRKMNLPYRMLGGTSFYQRKEVKDLLAYLRFIVNHNDEEALKRIINEPKRGIGPSNIEKIVTAAATSNLSLWEVMCQASQFLPGRTATAVIAFAQFIQSMAKDLDKQDAYEVAHTVAQQSGLLKSLYEDKTVEGLARYENLQELLNGIKAFTTHPEQTDTSLATFLQDVALATNSDMEDEQGDKISLMTIHAAKGLEFKYVYIVGIEEDLFPSPMMLGSKEELEEERRLFYVALTRAQEKIFLSYSISRYRFGKLKQCEASRFIKEIDPTYLQMDTTSSGSIDKPATSYTQQFIRSIRTMPQPKRVTVTPAASIQSKQPAFQASDTSQLTPGMQVEHPTFGIGQVTLVNLTGTHQKATIVFEKLGEKTLLLSFAKLKILREYGRNIQKLIAQLKQIESKDMRTQYAKAILDIMGLLHSGQAKTTNEHSQRRWDDLFIMADYQLDIDSPYPIPSIEIHAQKPQRLVYSKQSIKFRHCGRHVEQIIQAIPAETDPIKRFTMLINAGKLIKNLSTAWNKDNVNNHTILSMMKELTGDALTAEIEKLGTENHFNMPPTGNGSKEKAAAHKTKNNGAVKASSSEKMNKFRIYGGKPLQGSIHPQGSKNEAFQVICTTLLTAEPIIIHNVPDIVDVRELLVILELLGVKIQKLSAHTYRFQSDDISLNHCDIATLRAHAGKLRASVLLLGPMVARFGQAIIPLPGGDKIGRRRLDTHFIGIRQLGATFHYDQLEQVYRIEAKNRLQGNYILLDESSVTGTANIIMAAALAQGTTTLYNAACEPHIQQLCKMLVQMGAHITGIGSNLVTIEGVEGLHGTEHTVLPDLLEIGSFIGLATMTNSQLTIKNAIHTEQLLEPALSRFRSLGVQLNVSKNDITIPQQSSYEIQQDLNTNRILTISDAVWPGFPSDLLSILLVTAIQAKGSVLFHQKMYESRLFFVDNLIEMGAKLILCDPHRVHVVGLDRSTPLRGIRMASPDIRAGIALLIAALSAEGKSIIENAHQIDRGYANIEHRLQQLGADIERID